MKNRIIATGAATALLAGALVGFAAAPASATYEECVPAAAWTEVIEHPGVGTPTIEAPNPDYVAEVPAIPAQGNPTISVEVTNPDYVPAKDAVYENHITEKEYKKYKGKWPFGWWDVQWFPVEAQPHGWEWTGNVKMTPVEVTPAQPAVGTPTIWVDQPNPAYVPEVPAVPAQGTPTIEVPNPDYVAPTTETVEHPAVTCPAPPAHTATGATECGEWTITIGNEQEEGYENGTASFVLYIDGEFESAHAVMGGESTVLSGSFDEDSGTHEVIVRSGPAQGDRVVFSLIVESDCEVTVPPTEEPTEPTEPEEPTTPVTPEEPAAPAAPEAPAPAAAPAAAAAKTATVEADEADTLAQTGIDPLVLALGLPMGVAALAAGGLLLARRRQVMNADES